MDQTWTARTATLLAAGFAAGLIGALAGLVLAVGPAFVD
jgi:hypothetical protein